MQAEIKWFCAYKLVNQISCIAKSPIESAWQPIEGIYQGARVHKFSDYAWLVLIANLSIIARIKYLKLLISDDGWIICGVIGKN